MAWVALITWVVTAGFGFFMLLTWARAGGIRAGAGASSHLPPPLVFGHFLLAAAGLVVWIVYLATDRGALAWTSFGILVAVALLGFAMFARWVPVYRAAPAGEETTPAERHLPVPVVAAHGLLGAATLVLVLLAALGLGGS
jgi:hypothetical protein